MALVLTFYAFQVVRPPGPAVQRRREHSRSYAETVRLPMHLRPSPVTSSDIHTSFSCRLRRVGLQLVVICAGLLAGIDTARLHSNLCQASAPRPPSLRVRQRIQAGHRTLYIARSTANAFGMVDGPEDVFRLPLHGGVRNPIGTGNSSVQSGSPRHSIRLPMLRHPSLTSSANPATAAPSPFVHRINPAVYT
ncbi:hypothetical protein V8D89_010545 [Ganoderma adspersum]